MRSKATQLHCAWFSLSKCITTKWRFPASKWIAAKVGSQVGPSSCHTNRAGGAPLFPRKREAHLHLLFFLQKIWYCLEKKLSGSARPPLSILGTFSSLFGAISLTITGYDLSSCAKITPYDLRSRKIKRDAASWPKGSNSCFYFGPIVVNGKKWRFFGFIVFSFRVHFPTFFLQHQNHPIRPLESQK